VARESGLIDPAAHDRVVQPLAIHLFWLDHLGHRVHELVALPEARFALGKFHPLLHELLAVDVLVVELIGADALLVSAMRSTKPSILNTTI